MKPRLAEAAARRLAERRRDHSGPLATAQKALWHALMRGDMAEALRQSGLVRSIRGPQPLSPLALKLIERFNRMAAGSRRRPPRKRHRGARAAHDRARGQGAVRFDVVDQDGQPRQESEDEADQLDSREIEQ